MKASNPKEKVDNTKELNNLDYITDISETTKNMVNNYSYALNEVSNDTFYKIYLKIFEEVSYIQREIFLLMFKKGWYTLESVAKQKINTAYNKYSTQIEQI